MPDVLAEVRSGWLAGRGSQLLDAIHAGIVEPVILTDRLALTDATPAENERALTVIHSVSRGLEQGRQVPEDPDIGLGI